MDSTSALTQSSGQTVHVVSKTWARDAYELFDYEAPNLHSKTLTVPQSMKCIRNGTDVDMIGEHAPSPPGTDPLLRLVQKNGTFWVDTPTPSSSSKKLWRAVRDFGTSGHALVEGDVIKLGRFKFQVRQLVASGDAQPELQLDDTDTIHCADPASNSDLDRAVCRICLMEGPAEDDPLVTPCSCRGSIEYIHLGCLRHWIKGRLHSSANSGGSYFHRPLNCELCKAVYPTYVRSGSERVCLAEVPHARAPYIVLKPVVRSSQQNNRGFHVISVADKAMKFGRSSGSDVHIEDVSVSRCHAKIRFHMGQFLLEDNNSKFGTLVALKKSHPLEVGNPISVQIGRTVLSLTLQLNQDGIIADEAS